MKFTSLKKKVNLNEQPADMETQSIPEIKRKKYFGAVVLSDFQARCRFIKTRIRHKFSRDEVAFLLGRSPHLITFYEQMAGGVKLSSADAEVLSDLFKEDMSFVLEVDQHDQDKRQILGLQYPYKGKIEYEVNHGWSGDVDDRLFVIAEKPRNEVLPSEERLVLKAVKEVGRLLEMGYFSQTKSALDVYRYVYRELSKNLRPLLLKKAIYHYLQEKQLVCFSNKNGHFRYHVNLVAGG